MLKILECDFKYDIWPHCGFWENVISWFSEGLLVLKGPINRRGLALIQKNGSYTSIVLKSYGIHIMISIIYSEQIHGHNGLNIFLEYLWTFYRAKIFIRHFVVFDTFSPNLIHVINAQDGINDISTLLV